MAVKRLAGAWKGRARRLAREAHEGLVPQPQRVSYVAELQAICIYSNYAGAPETCELELQELRWWLTEQRVKVLACESYPYFGPDAGSSCVMIIDAGEDRVADVERWVEGVARYVARRRESPPTDRIETRGPSGVPS